MPKDTLFAYWVKRFRLYLDMTQTDFAALVGATMNTIQRWEYGDRLPNQSAVTALRLLAEKYDFEPPPEVQSRRGPKRSCTAAQ